MSKKSKNYQEAQDKLPKTPVSITKSIEALKKVSYTKFNGTIDLHLVLNLGKKINPKSLKGTLVLPHPISTTETKVAVFTNKENESVAKKAGADFYELEKLSKDINDGKIDFDVAIATPNVMGDIARLGKQLGPKGLMPNPKLGTVTEDLESVIKEFKKGKDTFASDDSGVMHFPVGKIDMDTKKIKENITICALATQEVVNIPPTRLLKKAYLAPTMGPSVEITGLFE